MSFATSSRKTWALYLSELRPMGSYGTYTVPGQMIAACQSPEALEAATRLLSIRRRDTLLGFCETTESVYSAGPA